MQPLMGPLGPQVMGTLQYPEREKPTDSLQALELKVNPFA